MKHLLPGVLIADFSFVSNLLKSIVKVFQSGFWLPLVVLHVVALGGRLFFAFSSKTGRQSIFEYSALLAALETKYRLSSKSLANMSVRAWPYTDVFNRKDYSAKNLY